MKEVNRQLGHFWKLDLDLSFSPFDCVMKCNGKKKSLCWEVRNLTVLQAFVEFLFTLLPSSDMLLQWKSEGSAGCCFYPIT